MNAGRSWAARITALLGAASLAACIGSVGGDGDPDRIPSSEEGVDARLDSLQIICESTLTVTGTYEQTRPQPVDMSGCWEVGIWEVNWDIDFQGCDPQPGFADTFTYEARRDDEDNADSAITWQDDLASERVNLKISTAADGLCHGSFEHFGDAGDNRIVITLQPTLQADGTLSGIGAWSLYQEDPF